MAKAIRETEWKYGAPPGTSLPDLLDLPRVASRADEREVELRATYYDSEAFDLIRAGITLRKRTGGSDAGWHLKIPRGRGTRTELQLPLTEQLPAEFESLLTARLRGRELRPVALITTRRRVSSLADAAGEALAEIALDDVTAEKLGRTAALTRWEEIEFELADGAPGGSRLLKAADRSLRRAGLVRSGYASKLEMALGGALPEAGNRPTPSASSSAGEVVSAYLSRQFEQLLRWDVPVRCEEPDAVHQMRVAARRMRAVLQDFGRVYEREQTEAVIEELRWLGQELGRARDEEVLADQLLSGLGQVPAESVLGPVRARIAGHYAPRKAEAQAGALAALRSARYVALLDRVEAFIADPPLTERGREPAKKVLARLLRRSRRRVDQRMRTAWRTEPGPGRDLEMHRVRKSAKRARYAAEAVSTVDGKKAAKAAAALKRVQSKLGDQHDAVIASGELRHLGIRAHSAGENAFTYGLLQERQRHGAQRLERKAHRAWKDARRRLKAAT